MKPRLPGILGEIADVAGEAAALNLARERGGTTMTFSGRPDSELARIVGPEEAVRIAELFGGVIKYRIPMAHLRGQRGRRMEAARLSEQGLSAPQIALQLDVHERTVFRVRNRKKSGKLPLFDDTP